MKNRMKIEVLGAAYAIDTAEDEEYVLALAKEIDEQASVLIQQNPKMSPNDALVLCALGSTDSYHKSEDAADHLRAQLTGYLEDAAKARIELDEARREIERLRKRIDAMQGGPRA